MTFSVVRTRTTTSFRTCDAGPPKITLTSTLLHTFAVRTTTYGALGILHLLLRTRCSFPHLSLEQRIALHSVTNTLIILDRAVTRTILQVSNLTSLTLESLVAFATTSVLLRLHTSSRKITLVNTSGTITIRTKISTVTFTLTRSAARSVSSTFHILTRHFVARLTGPHLPLERRILDLLTRTLHRLLGTGSVQDISSAAILSFVSIITLAFTIIARTFSEAAVRTAGLIARRARPFRVALARTGHAVTISIARTVEWASLAFASLTGKFSKTLHVSVLVDGSVILHDVSLVATLASESSVAFTNSGLGIAHTFP